MSHKFVPALRYSWLTRWYDIILSVTFPEKKIKQGIINQLNIHGPARLLDFGVGTGTLSLMIKKQVPEAHITGVDVDKRILALAQKKTQDLIKLQHYDGYLLPFDEKSFEIIVSSLVFHHIPTENKKTLLKELWRVSTSNSSLHIADFGKPANLYAKLAFSIFRRFDGEENTRVNARGLLSKFISEAGFKNVQQTAYFNTAVGTVVLLKATKT